MSFVCFYYSSCISMYDFTSHLQRQEAAVQANLGFDSLQFKLNLFRVLLSKS